MSGQRAGLPQKSWQVALNNRLYALYLKGRGLSRADYYRHYAQAFRYILENMELKVYDHELIVGNPSAHRVGAPIHPDLGGLLMLPEVRGINTRTQTNPMELEPAQLGSLKDKIFPYWFNKSVLALTPLYSSDPDLFNYDAGGALLYLNPVLRHLACYARLPDRIEAGI